MKRFSVVLLAILTMGLFAGCSQYVSDFDYAPRTAIAQVQATAPQVQPPATVFASIIGVRRADKKRGIPESVEARVMVANDSTTGPVTFDPRTLQLSGDLTMRFGVPILQPAGPFTIPPGQSASVQALFGFPPGRTYDTMQMSALHLRWQIEVGSQTLAQYAMFTRVFYAYYYPPAWDYPYYPYDYWGPPGGIYFRGGYGRWRR